MYIQLIYYANNQVSRDTFCALDRVLSHQNKFDDSLKLCKNALEKGLNESAVFNSLAGTLLQLSLKSTGDVAKKHLNEALKYAEKALKFWPDDAFLHCIHGEVLHALGRDKEAVVALKKAYDQFQIHKDDDGPDFNEENNAAFELTFNTKLAPLMLTHTSVLVTEEKLTPVVLLPKGKAATDTTLNEKIKAKNLEATAKLVEKQAMVEQFKADFQGKDVATMMQQVETLSHYLSPVRAELDDLRASQQARASMIKADKSPESYFEAFTKVLISNYRAIIEEKQIPTKIAINAREAHLKMNQVATREDEFAEIVMKVGLKLVISPSMSARLDDKKALKITADNWTIKVKANAADIAKQYKKDHDDNASKVGHHDAWYLTEKLISGTLEGFTVDHLTHVMGADSDALPAELVAY